MTISGLALVILDELDVPRFSAAAVLARFHDEVPMLPTTCPGEIRPARGMLLLMPPVLLSLTVATSACAQSRSTALSEFDLDRRAGVGLSLTERLREISGLAMTTDGRALAHDDELGIIYEIDLETGDVVKEFRLGNATARADFEGIAVAGDYVYLVTSDGTILESPEGGPAEHVQYNTYETGVGQECEIEGLAFDPSDRVLLLPCKEARVAALEGLIVIFRWSLDRRRLAEPARITIPRRRVTARIWGNRFRPSAIERHPVTRTYFVISSREPAIIEITARGELLDVRTLSNSRHGQPEGIAFAPDLSLVIADEGERHGHVTRYRRSIAKE